MAERISGLRAVSTMGLRESGWCHYFFRLVLEAAEGDWEVTLSGRCVADLLAAGALRGAQASFASDDADLAIQPDGTFRIAGVVRVGAPVPIEVLMPVLRPLAEYGKSTDRRILAWRPTRFEARRKDMASENHVLNGLDFVTWAKPPSEAQQPVSGKRIDGTTGATGEPAPDRCPATGSAAS